MDELAKIRQSELAWGSIDNLVERIIDIEENIEGGWMELVDMVADAMSEEGEGKSTFSSFIYLFNFLYHLLFRLKTNPNKRKFNQVDKIRVAGKEVYRITNYDYKTFKWAKKSGFGDGVSNDCIDIPGDKLSTKQIASIERRCK